MGLMYEPRTGTPWCPEMEYLYEKMTKIAAAVAALGVMASSLTGCGGGASGAISVITREDGSGTRGAFTELCGIVEDDKDNTVSSAEVNQTAPQLC